MPGSNASSAGWVTVPPRLRRSNHDEIVLMICRCHVEPVFTCMRVHLAPEADLAGNVDAGLHREADAGDDAPRGAALAGAAGGAESVQAHPVDRVAGAADDPVAMARRVDDPARGAVCLGAGDAGAGFEPLAEEIERRIPRAAHDGPELDGAVRRRADRGHPGLVGVDAARLRGPEIEEQQRAGKDGEGARLGCIVMRARSIRAVGHARWRVGNEPGAVDPLEYEARQLMLGNRIVFPGPLPR